MMSCAAVKALEKGRNLAEKAAVKKDLSAPCKALVMLAEPVDEYAAYKSSLTLNYIAQNAKAIESAFGWRVRIPVVCCSILVFGPSTCFTSSNPELVVLRILQA
jgi:hypothetical protein